jgi:hypothetical protein
MLPDAIQDDVGALLSELQSAGLRVTDFRYDESHFGNYLVELVGSGGAFQIVRDRGYYHIGGDEEHLRRHGALNSFKNLIEFREAVLIYAQTIA